MTFILLNSPWIFVCFGLSLFFLPHLKIGVAGSCEMLETSSKKTVHYHIPKNGFHTWICGFSQFIFEDMDLLLPLSCIPGYSCHSIGSAVFECVLIPFTVMYSYLCLFLIASLLFNGEHHRSLEHDLDLQLFSYFVNSKGSVLVCCIYSLPPSCSRNI